MKQFTRIRGAYSEARRLVRLGKIRLGLKIRNQGGKEYPTETEYFVCPEEVQAVYGETPTELDVLLPNEDETIVFPQKLAMYGSGSGLKCHGNGVEAERYNEKTNKWEEKTCPCEHLKTVENPQGRCDEKSDLMVMLPLVSMGGVYQIKTGSAASTANINSSLEMTREIAGRISFLPMKLKRVPQEMTHEGKKRTHYIMTLTLNATWQQAAALRKHPDTMLIPAQYQIPEPLDENPELDPPDKVVVDASDLADMEDAELADVQAKLNKQLEHKAQGNGAERSSGDHPASHPTTQHRAPVPPSQSEEVESKKKPGKEIPANEWKKILGFIDNDSALTDLKQVWKETHKVENVSRLTSGGQQSLVDYLRQNAIGFPY